MKPKEVKKQASIACQIQAQTSYFMSTLNGHIKDKDQESTLFWQQRAAHWSLVDRMLRGLPH